MSTKKNIEENALLEVSDEELAKFSGGGLVSTLAPIVEPLLTPVLSTVDSIPIPNIVPGLAPTNPGTGGSQ